MTANPSGAGYAGQAGLGAGTSQFNQIQFMIDQFLGRIATTKLVKVLKVIVEDGDPSPVGFVDVLPLVNLTDGLGNATKHGTVFKLPFFRLQGGPTAIVMNPTVDDIGIAIICDRDISTIKETRVQGNPGSFRRYDVADGLYVGGFLNGTPTRYVQFKDADLIAKGFDNINAEATAGITLKAPAITLDGQVAVTGNCFVDGDVKASAQTANFVTMLGHKHAANNTPPTPGF